MKKALSRLFVPAFAFLLFAAFAVPAESFAGARVEVRLAPMAAAPAIALPRLGRNQGWLTITNRDWKPYTLNITGKGRMSLVEGAMPRGTVIRSGTRVTMAVDRDNWELSGDSRKDLRVRVREGRTSTVMLEPFGFVNSTGLRGTSNDGDRARTEVLFESRVPVVVHQPPVVVHRPPIVVHTPPPVIITPPHGRPGGRPGPDRDRNDRNDRDRNDRDRNDRNDRNDNDRRDNNFPFGNNRR